MHPSSPGFAAIDALVALVILSTTIAFTLSALDTARRDATMTAETPTAAILLRDRMEQPSFETGLTLGRTEGFDWRAEVRPVGRASDVLKSCARSVELRSLATGRRYAASTAVPCPRPGATR